MAQPYITNPEQAIQQGMFPPNSPMVLQGAGAAATQPQAQNPLLAQQPVPQGITTDQIMAMFAPLMGDIQNQQGPIPRPVPQGPSNMQSFLGALAANMGSQFTRNPMFAQDFARQQEEQQKNAQQIQAENYNQDLAFNQNKHKQLLAIRGQALESALGNAIKNGDTDKQAVISQNLLKLKDQLQEQLTQEEQAGKTAGELKVQALKNQGDKATQEKEADKDIQAIQTQYGVSEATARNMKMSGGLKNVTKQVEQPVLDFNGKPVIDPTTKRPMTKMVTTSNPTPFATESEANDLISSNPDWAASMAAGKFPEAVPNDAALRVRLRKKAAAAIANQSSMAGAVRQ